jgi:rhomboid protease GluP
MFKRQTTGSVICVSCGYLVGVTDDRCYNCGRRNPGLWGFAPALRSLGHDLGFVPFVTAFCILMYGLTLFQGGIPANRGVLSFLSPNGYSLFLFGSSGVVPVFEYHRWWTPLSAGWLHGGLLHIGFNLMWIRQLAPAIGELYGPGRMVIIYTVGSVVGFLTTTLAGELIGVGGFPRAGVQTVGASAAIFGLLGALVYYGRRSGSTLIRSQAISWATTGIVFGFLIPGIDNYAHAGGMLGGYLIGRWLDPLKPERIDHMAIAVVCLAAAVLAVIASVIHGLPLVRLLQQ